MCVWGKREIPTDYGRELATLPLIVSASRATDIPAFYSRWFMERLRRGYAVRFNPFSGKREVVSFEQTRVFVFWSKYPAPMLQYLDELDRRGLNYYFLYTVNDYPEYELNVPRLEKRIAVFRELAERLGPDRVVWRFDPLIVSDRVSAEELLLRIEAIGKQLRGYTRRLIFSFVDLNYRKVQRNLAARGDMVYSLTSEEQQDIVRELKQKTDAWDMEPRSCASNFDFSQLGVRPGKCIDDELMVRLFPHERDLMKFLGYEGHGKYISRKKLKDKGQRPACGCVYSKDIGRYDTCPMGCVYCYANRSLQIARDNFRQHNYINESL